MSRSLTFAKVICLASLFVLATPSENLHACPNCREALLNSGRAIGYAISILLLISAPFSLAAFWTTTIIRLRRKAAKGVAG